MERRATENGKEDASNDEPVAYTPMELRIRGCAAGTSAAASNRGQSSAGVAAKGEQVIRWGRFLSRRHLRVLLVENDDSTRHIVAALLRKCCYQVAAVADGLKAWEFLKEKHYNFDLVLTEVAMPSLSGIGLLSKIMSNDTCKNIPVIMMSSHDSIGIVFKCMLKGAADFLVKPVRKNELQNLWQHVWRKYCSTSCRNGLTNENPNQSEAMSENNADSNHASANAGNKSFFRDSCNKESDTQSSCSKPEAENENEKEGWEPVQTGKGSFSRELESKLDEYDADAEQLAAIPTTEVGEEAKDKLMGIEIKVTLSIQEAASTEKTEEENHLTDEALFREKDQVERTPKEDVNIKPDSFHQSDIPNEPSKQIRGFIGTIETGKCSYTVLGDKVRCEDGLCETAEVSGTKKDGSNFGSSPLWELSLRRSQLNSLEEHKIQERHILKRSDASAFSRYDNTTRLSSPKSGSSSASLCIRMQEYSVRCHPQADGDEIGDVNAHHSSVKEKGDGGETLVHCQLLSSSSKEDADLVACHLQEDAHAGHPSTERIFSQPQLGVFPLPIPFGSIPFQGLCAGYGPILQPIFYPDPAFPLHGSSAVEKINEALPYDQPGHSGHHLSNNLHYNSCRHHDQNCNPCQFKPGMTSQRVDIEGVGARAALHAAEEGNQSISYSRSIHNGSGSNVSNEDSNAAVNAGVALESGNEDGFQNCKGARRDHDHARREAALMKFRLKRKDRCFEKKVRYHSRKKLAEQRPRLKGQFVRQTVVESSTTATETDD